MWTVLVQGISIKPLVKLLRIKRDISSEKGSMFLELLDATMDHVLAGIEEISGVHGKNWFRDLLQTYNDRYMRKVLQRSNVISLMTHYEKIAFQQHIANLGDSRYAKEFWRAQSAASGSPPEYVGQLTIPVGQDKFRRRDEWRPSAITPLSMDSKEAPTPSLKPIFKLPTAIDKTYIYDRNLTHEDDEQGLDHELHQRSPMPLRIVVDQLRRFSKVSSSTNLHESRAPRILRYKEGEDDGELGGGVVEMEGDEASSETPTPSTQREFFKLISQKALDESDDV